MAVQLDKKGDIYVDNWEDGFGVFGTESGFCYELCSDRGTAEEQAKNLREKLGIVSWGQDL
jgi:hypothetical protein